MRKYNRILIAIDPVGFDQAIKNAIAELLADEAQLDIICVIANTRFGTVAMGRPLDVSLATAIEQQQVILDWADSIGMDADRICFVSGDRVYCIAKRVEELQADLLVLGYHHMAGLQGKLDSTTVTVLNELSCDVLLIHTD